MMIALHRAAALVSLVLGLVAPLTAQLRSELVNGGFEQGQVGEPPEDWLSRVVGDGQVALQAEGSFEAERCVLLDSGATPGNRKMTASLMQPLDATPWRGKRVRLRAAVRTADLAPGASARMWLRVDLPDGKRGAFDNMGDRPIRAGQWAHYQIVANVAENAERMLIGAFLIGNGKAWFDDVTLEVVDTNAEPTPGERGEASSRQPDSRSSSESSPDRPARRRPPRDPLREQAMADAERAPQQPFWTWWLVLPAFAIVVFFVGLWPMRSKAVATAPHGVGWWRWFALRFTVCYWLLFSLPSPFATILSWTARTLEQGAARGGLPGGISSCFREAAGGLSAVRAEFDSWLAHRTAEWCFGMEGPLIPPRGSGDTTMSYLLLLDWFVLALLMATVWTVLVRRVPRRDASIDLLRSFLRYVLAFAMLQYGLSKVSLDRNQFAELAQWRLDKTWGDSSPMGLVWGFMGASRPYTIFAGLGEVVAAVLLIWRHTALLGAIVAIGVMTNVVMLNYCYDVPVKIYSTHLLVMGVLILVPDAWRLLAMLMWNRNPTHAGTASIWSATRRPWLRWGAKAPVVIVCFLVPIGLRAWDLANREPTESTVPSGYRLTDRGYRWINEVPFHK